MATSRERGAWGIGKDSWQPFQSRRTTEPQNHRNSEPQSLRTTEPQSLRASEPQSRRGQQDDAGTGRNGDAARESQTTEDGNRKQLATGSLFRASEPQSHRATEGRIANCEFRIADR